MGLIPRVPLRQFNREELLDSREFSKREIEKSLRDIARINHYLNGAAPICAATFDLLEQHNLQRATILDIGTGSGDIPLRLVQQARARGIELEVVGLDLNATHLKFAQSKTQNQSEIHLIQADAFSLPLRDHSVDVVISSLFLHHFRPAQIEALLNEFSRVSRVGWAMNDLVRDALPLWFFRLTRPLFAHSFLTRHDGEASIRRAYTLEEMQQIVARKGVEVREVFPYRVLVSWSRSAD